MVHFIQKASENVRFLLSRLLKDGRTRIKRLCLSLVLSLARDLSLCRLLCLSLVLSLARDLSLCLLLGHLHCRCPGLACVVIGSLYESYRHVAHTNGSCLLSHVTRANESCRTYEYPRMSHVAHMNESCRTYE